MINLVPFKSISDPFYFIRNAEKDKRPPEQLKKLVDEDKCELAKTPNLYYRIVKKLTAEEAEVLFPKLLPFLRDFPILEPYLYKGLSKNPAVVPAFVRAVLKAVPDNRTAVLISLHKSGIEFSIPELVDNVYDANDPEFKAYVKANKVTIIAYCITKTNAASFLCGASFEDPEIAQAALALAVIHDALAKKLKQQL